MLRVGVINRTQEMCEDPHAEGLIYESSRQPRINVETGKGQTQEYTISQD